MFRRLSGIWRLPARSAVGSSDVAWSSASCSRSFNFNHPSKEPANADPLSLAWSGRQTRTQKTSSHLASELIEQVLITTATTNKRARLLKMWNEMTPEEQYITLMDAAYNATDKESYYKFMQNADNILMQQTKQVLQNREEATSEPTSNLSLPSINTNRFPRIPLQRQAKPTSGLKQQMTSELLQLLIQYNDFTQRTQ